ncbi:hypothetical protein P280DRAFT_470267 [Massarina eburnea CBS 473.64]|uniref:Uncharacterized protein n=1 Tax=Massarina eburnea CBS 473.64 TaxID=1395130 RepID=A0A6A6RWB9_9PLEO|nr:hypothetical protein P280DRAFT_470267 [Massarina eburnea CBS 473.64]
MSDNIAYGFWYNWEHGKVKGATLTIPFYTGAILVSFLSLFVQFAGACFYRVLCFIIHQSRSTTEARNGLFHQQQAILRNSATAPSALWNLVRSAVAWKGKKSSLPLIFGTMFHIALFGAAALLASRIASMGAGQALILSQNCGFPKEIPDVRHTTSSALNPQDLLTFNSEVLMGRMTMMKSMAYVRSCYNDYDKDSQGVSGACSKFVQPQLSGVNASAVINATCPFTGACATSAAAQFDSGHLHSNIDLGINTPKEDGITMRRVTTCAPILSNKYATNWTENLPEGIAKLGNTSVKFYEFGKEFSGRNCEATAANHTTNRTTFCVSKYMKENINRAYTLRASTAYYKNPNPNISDFTPIPEFAVPQADVTLLSIFSKAEYTSSVTDPLFNAQNASASPPFFVASDDLSILGCTEQYQICNPKTTRCTALTGLYDMLDTVDSNALELSQRQRATFHVLWKVAWSMALQFAGEIIADDLLLAQDWVFTTKSTTSSALSSDQWQLEAHHLHNLSLAVLQHRIYEHALPENFQIRPGVNSLEQIETPTDPDVLDICRQQKMRSAQVYSVSVLGMSIILVVGSLLILLDWVFIERIFWFRSHVHACSARKAEWTSSGTLQLQKQVLESKGIGSWMATTADMAFPVLVERGKVFRQLGVEEYKMTDIDTGYTKGHGGLRAPGYAVLRGEEGGGFV